MQPTPDTGNRLLLSAGPDSRAVFELLATVDHLALRGNHKELLLALDEPPHASSTAPLLQLLRFARAELGKQWMAYVHGLPDHRSPVSGALAVENLALLYVRRRWALTNAPQGRLHTRLLLFFVVSCASWG